MHRKHLVVASSLVCMLGYGCGDDGGISSSSKLSQLSAADKKSVCDSLQTKFTRIEAASAKLSCTVTAFGSGNVASCNTEVASCIKASANDPTYSLGCDASAGDLDNCGDVTVGDLNSCADALATSIESLSNKISCSSSAADIQGSSDYTTPAECTKLQTSCPSLAGDNSLP